MKKRNNMIGVGIMTVGMGVVESNDKVVLALTSGSITLVVDGEKAPVQLRAESANLAQQWEAALRAALEACEAQRKASVMQSADFARKGSSTGKLRAPSSGSEAIGGAGIGDAHPGSQVG